MTKKQLRRLGVLPYEDTPIPRSTEWNVWFPAAAPEFNFEIERTVVTNPARMLHGTWTWEEPRVFAPYIPLRVATTHEAMQFEAIEEETNGN